MKSNRFDQSAQETREYLNKFVDVLKTSIINMIENGIKNISIDHTDDIDTEILHHAYFCKSLWKNLVENNDYIEKVKINLIIRNKSFFFLE